MTNRPIFSESEDSGHPENFPPKAVICPWDLQTHAINDWRDCSHGKQLRLGDKLIFAMGTSVSLETVLKLLWVQTSFEIWRSLGPCSQAQRTSHDEKQSVPTVELHRGTKALTNCAAIRWQRFWRATEPISKSLLQFSSRICLFWFQCDYPRHHNKVPSKFQWSKCCGPDIGIW